jgi:4-amino-4-deoxy-L-arabinose transferase-like glycosyltransferase
MVPADCRGVDQQVRCEDAGIDTQRPSRLAQAIFVLYCVETLFSLPFRSVYLSGHTAFVASIAALCVLAVISILFVFRDALLTLLARLLRFRSIGNRAWFAFWLMFGIILRLAWAISFPVTPKSDHLAYFQLAANMAQGQTGAGAYWPPGFSMFLAPFFAVFGVHLWVAELCGLLFFVTTYFLTYAIAIRIEGGLTPRIAPMLVAIWPGYFTLSGVNCREVFLAVLLPATLLMYLNAFDCHPVLAAGLNPNSEQISSSNRAHFRWGFAISAGLCMGLAALTQPGFILFPAVVLGLEILRGTNLMPAVGRTAVFSIALLLAILPWTFRNYLVFHRMVLISTNGGSVFYRANNPLANANYSAEGEVHLPANEFVADKMGYELAIEWIEHHPGSFAALMAKKQLVFLGDDALGAYETLKRDLNPSAALYASVKGISNLFWLAVWTVLLLGFPLMFRSSNWQLWFGLLFLPLLYQWAIDSVFESGPRHHVPHVALISVLIGIVIASAAQPIPASGRAPSMR